MTTPRSLLHPAAWAIYVVIVLEFLFMISPFALYFYSAYAPALNILHWSPSTAWLTGFFLPHFSVTTSPLLNNLKPVGFLLAAAGLLIFLVGAAQIYLAKLWSGRAVTGGLYALVRHPQYTALIILGLGTLLIWPRFLVLITFITMVFIYFLLARWRSSSAWSDLERSTGRTGREPA